MSQNRTHLDLIEDEAKKILDPVIYDFIAGGAGQERAIKNNIEAHSNYQIIPRVLMGVGNVDTTQMILGEKIDFPVLIAPCAFHKMVHKRGELATACAAKKRNVIMTLSSMSSFTIEEVSEESNAKLWFQLYFFKNRDITKNLIRRAESAGYSALVVTVDTPVMGMRLRDIRNHFSLPTGIEAANLVGTGFSNLSEKGHGSKIKDHTDELFDSNLTWSDIDWLASFTKLPIILKGILHTDDALEATRHKIAGIVVSNHGGRQIDNAIAPMDALANITQVVDKKMLVFMDGGVRTGEDIFRAIALNADGVFVGRPALWSLATDGENGVASMLTQLQQELVLAMRLAGCPTLNAVREMGPSLLFKKGFSQSTAKNEHNQPHNPSAHTKQHREMAWLKS